MSETEETGYTVRNYDALDNQVAQMAAREAEETRRIRYLNFFRLAQVFAIVCLALGLLFVLAGWGIKMARSYKQEVIYKGSELQPSQEGINDSSYYHSEGAGTSLGKIVINEAEKSSLQQGLEDPEARKEIEGIFEEQNYVAGQVNALEEQQQSAFVRVGNELDLSEGSDEQLDDLINANPELADVRDELTEGAEKLKQLEEVSAENMELKKNSADSPDLDPDREKAIGELEEYDPALANKASVAAASTKIGDDIVRQLEEQNRELSEEELAEMPLSQEQLNAVYTIASKDPELAQEMSDAFRASNALNEALGSAKQENEKIRQEQGLAPSVSDGELEEVKEALSENPQLAKKIEDAVTKPNTLTQEALAQESDNLRDQLQTAGERNDEMAKQLADAEEANDLMENNFEAGLNDAEKAALAPILEDNPSLKNKIGAALNPEPGSPQELANKAAEAQQEAREAKVTAASAEKRAQEAEQALEAAQEGSNTNDTNEAFEKGFTPQEKEALKPVLDENPGLKKKLSNALDPEEGSEQDLANQVAEALEAADTAQKEAQAAKRRAEGAERALAEGSADGFQGLEDQLERAQQDLEQANEELRQAKAKVEELEQQQPESLLPGSMDELLKELSPSERAELEGLMAKSPDLLEALKRQAAEEARRAMNLDVKENVSYQNREVASGIPGYTITTWFDFTKATDQKTSSRRCSLARQNSSGIGIDVVKIAEQQGNDAPVIQSGLEARSISQSDLSIVLPKCSWRTD